MELGKQIQFYRKQKQLSQDDLAEKLFVSRQSISNWERGATYPDIQNLLLLSQVFEISLDTLVKGDIEEMKQIIHQANYTRYVKDAQLLTLLLLVTVLTGPPLILYLNWYGIAITLLIWAVAFFYSLRVEKFKKAHNLRTLQEIVAYDEGKTLTEIEQAREDGKALYQKNIIVVAFTLISALLALLISVISLWLFPIK